MKAKISYASEPSIYPDEGTSNAMKYAKPNFEMKINSLEDLIKLIQKEGEIIIHSVDSDGFDITIYDDDVE